MIRKIITLFLIGTVLIGCKNNASEEESDVWMENGSAALQAHSFEEAITFFEEGIESDAEQAYRGIGIAKLGLGAYEDAIDYFDQALQAANGKADALAYDISYYKAAAYTKLNDLNKALEIYNALEAYHPDQNTYIGRGTVYSQMGNFELAKKDFDQAVALDPQNYAIYLKAYEVLKNVGRADYGEDYLKQALAIDKNRDRYNFEKGKIYYYLGQIEKAKTEFEKISEEDYPEQKLYQGYIYEAEGKKEEAIASYLDYLEKAPHKGEIYNKVLVLYMEDERYEDALALVEEGIENAESDIQNLYRNEIVIYERLTDFDTAKEKAEQYLEHYANDEEVQKELIFLESRSR